MGPLTIQTWGSHLKVGGPQIDGQVKINDSHEDRHLFVVSSPTSNTAVSGIRVGSDFEHWSGSCYEKLTLRRNIVG